LANSLAPTPFPLLPAHISKRILLVEDDPVDLARLKEIILRIRPRVDLVHVAHFTDAFDKLHHRQFDAVLLSLRAGESELVKRVGEQADAPIIVLADVENDPVALGSLQNGADDYLVKHSIDCDTLRHVLDCAIARNVWRRQMYVLSLVDELTGLYNRRGFMTLGEHQLTIAHRTGTGVNLAFADLDGLKFINDHFGHSAGDRALRDTAKTLKAAFHRESDLVARIGGDEFAVLWIANTPFSTDAVRARLKSALDLYVASQNLPYRLSLSIGVCQYQRGFANPLMEMLTEVDQRMYAEKHRAKINIA
jgi:two-component system, cell cycle response regulator